MDGGGVGEERRRKVMELVDIAKEALQDIELLLGTPCEVDVQGSKRVGKRQRKYLGEEDEEEVPDDGGAGDWLDALSTQQVLEYVDGFDIGANQAAVVAENVDAAVCSLCENKFSAHQATGVHALSAAVQFCVCGHASPASAQATQDLPIVVSQNTIAGELVLPEDGDVDKEVSREDAETGDGEELLAEDTETNDGEELVPEDVKTDGKEVLPQDAETDDGEEAPEDAETDDSEEVLSEDAETDDGGVVMPEDVETDDGESEGVCFVPDSLPALDGDSLDESTMERFHLDDFDVLCHTVISFGFHVQVNAKHGMSFAAAAGCHVQINAKNGMVFAAAAIFHGQVNARHGMSSASIDMNGRAAEAGFNNYRLARLPSNDRRSSGESQPHAPASSMSMNTTNISTSTLGFSPSTANIPAVAVSGITATLVCMPTPSSTTSNTKPQGDTTGKTKLGWHAAASFSNFDYTLAVADASTSFSNFQYVLGFNLGMHMLVSLVL